MLSSRLKLKNNRSGSVLVFILIIFLVISIMTSTIAFLFSSNIRMAKRQEDGLREHYLALSGIDVTISTLLSTVIVESGVEKTMAEKIIEGNADRQLNDEIDIEGEKVKINLDYKKDKKEFTIKSSVNTKVNYQKELSLNIVFSGNSYKKRWN